MTGGLTRNGRIYVGRRLQRRPSIASARTNGFTLIEVLIVLAITGLLFVSAAYLLAGKQNQTAFDQSIRQAQSQIQQIINEVAIGYYPNLGDLQCSAGGSGPIISGGVGTAQGANSGCIFIGKAVQFKVAGTTPEQFKVYTIAGLQKNSSGAETTSLIEAKPKVVAPSSAEPALPSSVTTNAMESGINTYRMWYENGGGQQNIGTIAFTNSLASYDSSGSIKSGSQQVNVVPVDTTSLNQAQLSAVDAINAKITTSPLNPAASATSGIFICLASGSTDQSGLITIGSNGRQLSVTLTVKSNKTCA